MINSMDSELRAGLMVLNMRASTLMERRKERVHFISPMDQSLLEISRAMKLTGMELTSGLTERNTRGTGSTIKCADRAL